jgi:insulysin
VQEKVMKDYLNVRFQQPYQQVMYNCSLLLEHKRWHTNDFIEVLPTLEASDLTAFFPRILSRIFLECYIAGTQSLLQVFLFAVATAFQIL